MHSNGQGYLDRNLPKLPYVELIGMAIENKGSSVHRLFRKKSAHKTGQQAMIASPSYRPVLAEPAVGSNRHFDNRLVAFQADLNGSERPFGDSISWPADGEYAGIVLEPKFSQDVKGPERRTDNR